MNTISKTAFAQLFDGTAPSADSTTDNNWPAEGIWVAPTDLVMQNGQLYEKVHYGLLEQEWILTGRAQHIEIGKVAGHFYLYETTSYGERWYAPKDFMAKPILDRNGRLLDVVALSPTSWNPSAKLADGPLKKYSTLQARLLAGETFTKVPATAYERGMVALGEAMEFGVWKSVQGQMWKAVSHGLARIPEIGNTHISEWISGLACGCEGIFSATDGAFVTRAVIDPTAAVTSWVAMEATAKQRGYDLTNGVRVHLVTPEA